jgi:DNA-binding transcriptional LysR family regulator
MELRTLRYFAVLAEELHFGRAAKRLHISQPPLSRQMAGLEQELGVTLFDRTRRQVQLTPAGMHFLHRVTGILADVTGAASAVRSVGRGEVGRLVIGFFLGASYNLLPLVLAKFRIRSPNVKLVLQDMSLPEVSDALRNNEIDVGFLRPPASDPSIASEVLLREPIVAALPEGNRFCRARRLRLTDLADEPFVMFSPMRSILYSQIMNACHESGFQPRVVEEARRPETILGLVGTGAGVALVAASVEMRGARGVVFKKISGLPMAETAVAWRRHKETPLLRSFLQTARQAVR